MALELFLEHGYDATPMSLVAKHTGLTKAGAYHYFESKEHLLYFVHKSHLDRLLVPMIEQAQQEQGRSEPGLDPTYTAFAAIGMCSWITAWYDHARPESGPEVANTMVDVFLRGVIRRA